MKRRHQLRDHNLTHAPIVPTTHGTAAPDEPRALNVHAVVNLRAGTALDLTPEAIRTTIERAFRARGQDEADVVGAHLRAPTSLSALQATARDRRNVFAALMEAVKTHSLGQISHALYEVGGEYRRNM